MARAGNKPHLTKPHRTKPCGRCGRTFIPKTSHNTMCQDCLEVDEAEEALCFLREGSEFHAYIGVDGEWAEEMLVAPLLNGTPTECNDQPGGGYEGLCISVLRSAAAAVARGRKRS